MTTSLNIRLHSVVPPGLPFVSILSALTGNIKVVECNAPPGSPDAWNSDVVRQCNKMAMAQRQYTPVLLVLNLWDVISPEKRATIEYALLGLDIMVVVIYRTLEDGCTWIAHS